MPLLLPPAARRTALSRRAFLRAAAAGAGALALARPARGAAAIGPPVWALLSDTHIHANPEQVSREQKMAANLRAAVAEVAEIGPRAALVNGDLALKDGQSGDYATFLSLLEPLRAAGAPLHLLLGNHDHRGNFLAAAESAASPIVEQRHVGAMLDGDLHWLFLDSLDRVDAVTGLLGPAQLQWLARALDAQPATPALVFLHHNPQADNMGIPDAPALLDVLLPRPQVKVVFFGHTHKWTRWETGGVHFVNLPAVAYAFDAKEPRGWVKAGAIEGGLALELRSLDPEHPRHGERVELGFRPDAPRRISRF
jgi:3',5'-cyclic AMP phosphodiesterase CpdA